MYSKPKTLINTKVKAQKQVFRVHIIRLLGIIDMRQRGISYNDCCSRYRVGHSTVKLIMSRFEEIGKDLDTLRQMNSLEVETAFYPPENIRRKEESVMPDYSAIHDRIMREGSKANLYFMWLRYKQEHPSGYQFTQFCHYYNVYEEKNHGSNKLRMAVERIPGEKVYIDWVSSLIYAEAFENEKPPSFIAGTVHVLEYYEAIPKYLVPDNLRAAISRHTKDELILNSAYQDLERFYEVVVLPPPPRKPTGRKGNG